MEARIPPPLIALVCVLLMGLSAHYVDPLPQWEFRWYLAAVFLMAGVAFDVAALHQFRKAKTTVNPLRPDRVTALVTTGIFQYSRNPMYVGMALILSSVAVYLWHPTALLPVLLFLLVITQWQIKPEEAALRQHFGAEFEAYCLLARRWL